MWSLGRVPEKRNVFFRSLPERGEWGPCPNFGPFLMNNCISGNSFVVSALKCFLISVFGVSKKRIKEEEEEGGWGGGQIRQ